MDKRIALFFLLIYVNLPSAFSQRNNKKTVGYLIIGMEGGFRGSMSRHTTPYMKNDQLHGNWAGMNDRIALASLWNCGGGIGYRFSSFPISILVHGGVQMNQNRNFPGLFEYDNKFGSIKTTFMTRCVGFRLQYPFFSKKKNNYEIGGLGGLNFLFDTFELNRKLNPYFINIDKLEKGDEFVNFQYIRDYIMGSNKSFGLQIDLGVYFQYFLKETFFIQANCFYQAGLRPTAGTGAVFLKSSDPKYSNTTSYSANKGDGFCINAGLGYRLPIKK